MVHGDVIQFVPSHKTSFFTNFGGAKNYIFLKKDLSLANVLGKALVSHAVVESIKIVMSIEMRIE